MKRTFFAFTIVIIMLITIGAKSSKTRWEYASLVMLSGNENIIFKSPDESFEATSFIGLDQKIGYKGKPTYPPEYPLFEYLGNQGWELVNITGEKDSMSGSLVCWFKRPK